MKTLNNSPKFSVFLLQLKILHDFAVFYDSFFFIIFPLKYKAEKNSTEITAAAKVDDT